MAMAAEPRRPCTVASGGDRAIGSSGGSYFRRIRTASLITLGIFLLSRVATAGAIKGLGTLSLTFKSFKTSILISNFYFLPHSN